MNKIPFLTVMIFSAQAALSAGGTPPPPTPPPPPGFPIDGMLILLLFIALTTGYYLSQKYKVKNKGS